MSQYVYKKIHPEFISTRKFMLNKTWNMSINDIGSTIQIFDAVKSTGSFALASDLNPVTRIDDRQGKVLSYNYTLSTGDYYYPSREEMCYSASVHQNNGTEQLIMQDGLPYYPPSGSWDVVGFPKRNIWYSLWHLFYRKYSPTVTGPNIIQVPGIYADEFESSSLDGSAYVFSISKNYFGDSIKKQSFLLNHYNAHVPNTPPVATASLYYTCNITDDGKGNLYDGYSITPDAKIGNISYTKGLVIITSEPYRNYFSSSLETFKNTATLNFNYVSEYPAIENEYTCIVDHNEFNMTYNITAYDSASYAKDFLINSVASDANANFHTFVTTIGLYSELGELLVVAKLPKPIRVEKDLDSIFIIRFDSPQAI